MWRWDNMRGRVCIMTKVMTEREQLELEMLGYIRYKQRIDEGMYPIVTLQSIKKHRDSILEKNSNKLDKRVHRSIGMAYTDGMFIPIDFPGTFIDASDVFAATYALDVQLGFQTYKNETYTLWILATNDEYMPILPMIYIQKNKFADYFTKRKRNDFATKIVEMCPNLKYPVCTFDEFESIIEKEHSLGGKCSKHFLLGQIYDAKNHIGLFDPQTISCELAGLSRDILANKGFICLDD